jgi:hypothetical protein
MSKKIVTGITVAVVILAVGFVVWLFLSGQVRVSWGKTANSTVAVVCDTSVVDTYNAAMNYTVRSGSTQAGFDEAGLTKLVTDIKSRSGYGSDATCQAMLFWAAIHANNYNEAKTIYDSVKKLHDERIFADSNIRGNLALFQYTDALDQINPSTQNQEGGAGGL